MLTSLASVQKLFILLELQLNVLLLQSKLVKSSTIINQLCWYNCIRVNNKILINPYYVCQIWDIILVPQYIFLISNLLILITRKLLVIKVLPLSHYILSYNVGLVIVIIYPNLFFNNIIIKIKLKHRLLMTSKFRWKFRRLAGIIGIARLKLLQYIQLFKL